MYCTGVAFFRQVRVPVGPNKFMSLPNSDKGYYLQVGRDYSGFAIDGNIRGLAYLLKLCRSMLDKGEESSVTLRRSDGFLSNDSIGDLVIHLLPLENGWKFGSDNYYLKVAFTEDSKTLYIKGNTSGIKCLAEACKTLDHEHFMWQFGNLTEDSDTVCVYLHSDIAQGS
jgi:hypothetical protein